jgi:hypothetical protein
MIAASAVSTAIVLIGDLQDRSTSQEHTEVPTAHGRSARGKRIKRRKKEKKEKKKNRGML